MKKMRKNEQNNLLWVVIAFAVLIVILFGLIYFSMDAVNKIKDTQTTEGSVCGKIDIQCITTPCNPIYETFSNKYEAEDRGAFEIKKGECITDFESCIAAGNPAMESYPRQCRDPKTDRTFTEIINLDEPDCSEGYYFNNEIGACINQEYDNDEKKIARIAIMPMSFYPVTISDVIYNGCEGCYTVKIGIDSKTPASMVFKNWTIDHTIS